MTAWDPFDMSQDVARAREHLARQCEELEESIFRSVALLVWSAKDPDDVIARLLDATLYTPLDGFTAAEQAEVDALARASWIRGVRRALDIATGEES